MIIKLTKLFQFALLPVYVNHIFKVFFFFFYLHVILKTIDH